MPSTATAPARAPKNSADRKTSTPAHPSLRSVTPHLVCAGAAQAIDFYQKAFGASEVCRLTAPDGKIIHAAVQIGDSTVMMVDEIPQCGSVSPRSLKGTAVTLHLNVPDVDRVFQQAVKTGATVVMPVADMFWGDRYGVLEDPFGHRWSVSTHMRDVPLDEMQAAATAMCSGS